MTATRRPTLSEIRQPIVTLGLIRQYQAGNVRAGDVLARAHAPLIRTIAMRLSRPHCRDWDDCLQEGRLGLLRACESYVDGLGSPSTYFGIWIRNKIIRFLRNHAQCVRFPVHQYDKNKGQQRLSIWKPRTRLFSEMPDERTASMDDAFEDALIDDTEPVDELLSDYEIGAALPRVAEWLLSRSTARSRDVLTRRHAEVFESHESIRHDYGVSRERIRQIESEALTACRRVARDAGFNPHDYDSFEAWIAAAIGVIAHESAAVAA